MLERFAVESEEALYETIQRGGINPTDVLQALFPGLKPEEMAAVTARRRIEDGKGARLYVQGGGLTPGVSLHFAECCSPLPGDRIVGIAQPNKSLAVHTIDCPRLAEYEDQEELWRDLHWTSEAERATVSRARLTATIRDAPGVLGQVCTAIGGRGGATSSICACITGSGTSSTATSTSTSATPSTSPTWRPR